ncbi:two-component sensor histidine kinase [Phyllobacterium phragmitis]|uniref:histidine kinase n=1 Tax=Phyllobacterium phragmitis TaxID=2670329 RepID=A0A2S9IJB3_9HYPH|nr:ATP-binding protein [Phyllobacterium phragmitis]PRD40620.1 two-component sensor histidine kinase [Phyllobacterium phragmitis]
MMRWWKRSLAAQFIGLMLLALVISQALAFFISWDERDKALRAAAKGEFFSRTTSLATLLESIPIGFREDVLLASGTGYTRFWISATDPVDADGWRREAVAQLEKPLPNLLDLQKKWQVEPKSPPVKLGYESGPFRSANASENWAVLASGRWPLPHPAKFLYFDGSKGMGLAVQLSDGTWLNSAYHKVLPSTLWNTQSLFSLGITAFVLSIIGVFIANRITSPLRGLALAAEALGRGETVPNLPESGPDDIRQTSEAFNRMQSRLHRFVEDRTRMLAAIGHDLRTPLTSLRLRAEFVSDPDLQQKMLAAIDEIQTMTEGTLALARGEATIEETRTIDLNALVGSLCDDLAELGQDVEFEEGAKANYRCRPDGLRRAIRNLVENAVRYGGKARVSVLHTSATIDIVVEDEGPGIPETAAEQVFAPFFRLEQSRNRDTGGVGLGLSIARAIVRHHGGDIILSQIKPGLRASICLPKR